MTRAWDIMERREVMVVSVAGRVGVIWIGGRRENARDRVERKDLRNALRRIIVS